MYMPPLWDAFAWLHIIDQSITLDNRDSIEMLREHTSRQQSGHTPTNHDSMIGIESLLVS